MNNPPADESPSAEDQESQVGPHANELRGDRVVLSPPAKPLSVHDRLDLAKWHIDRFDRLRVSTSSRAAALLSGGAILTAGNAVILSQMLQQTTVLDLWLVAVCTVGLTTSAGLIIFALIRATGALFVLKPSREMFPDTNMSTSLVFNAADTVRYAHDFSTFESAVTNQTALDVMQAAHVELWIGIRLYGQRYARLQSSVRALRNSAAIFLAVLTVLVVANFVIRAT